MKLLHWRQFPVIRDFKQTLSTTVIGDAMVIPTYHVRQNEII